VKTFITLIGAAVALGATASFVWLCSCGEAYYFPPSAWGIKAIVPEACRAIACRRNELFLLSQYKVIKFGDGVFTEDYVAPESVQFYDVAFSGHDGWAVGYDAATEKPFMVHNAGRGWTELLINEPELSAIIQVIPVGGGRCWLVAAGRNSLFFWDGTRLKSIVGGPQINGGCYDSSTEVLYVYRPKARDEWELLITGDGGKSWRAEEVPGALHGFPLHDIWSAAAADGAFYFAASGSGSYVVIKRTGGAAPGDYDIIFRSPLGAHFREVKDMAFNGLGAGVAVGDDTTVVFSPERIYVEETIDVQFKLVSADAAGGFWAYGEPTALYYRR
jgi:hypothetical protein